MHAGEIRALLGRLAGALGIAMLPPLALALWLSESAGPAFVVSSASLLFIGGVSWRTSLDTAGMEVQRQGIAAFRFVVAAWCLATLAGALPYVLHFGPGFFVNAVFESASGFSTTGASIFADVEALPRSILLWRALTQWLGGLGIVILFVWILGARQWGVDVLSAEAPGPTPEKTEPKLTETARDIVLVGATLTIVLAFILAGLGLSAFDAICHALATLATGGFSTRNAGLAAFAPAVQWTIGIFMVLAGVRFAIHIYGVRRLHARVRSWWWRMLDRRRRPVPASPLANYLGDPELRLYAGILAGATGLLALLRLGAGAETGTALRDAFFQTASIVTTTGFATADFAQWSDTARILILLLMFVGGCAGSTAGSIKVMRWVIVLKMAPVSLRVLNQPHAELGIRVGHQPVPLAISSTMTSFVLLFVGVAVAAGLALIAMGLDPLTAFSASVASVSNVGPGLGGVGPASNYAAVPAPGKLLLAALMIAGRLEITTVAVLFLAPLRAAALRLRGGTAPRNP